MTTTQLPRSPRFSSPDVRISGRQGQISTRDRAEYLSARAPRVS